MKSTTFKVEVIFGDVMNEDIISQDQRNKLNNFLAKIM